MDCMREVGKAPYNGERLPLTPGSLHTPSYLYYSRENASSWVSMVFSETKL